MEKKSKQNDTRKKTLRLRALTQELEAEKAVTFFATSLIAQTTVNQVLWDIAKNCINRLHFASCVVYWFERERGVLIPKVVHDTKSIPDSTPLNPIEISLGMGIVGSVAITGQPALVEKAPADTRNIPQDALNLAEIAVPILAEGTVIGVINGRHPQQNFFQSWHLSILTAVAALCAQKIKQVAVEQAYQQAERQLIQTNKRIAETKLLALRMQMNPHFIFNSLSSINSFILQKNVEQASDLLTKFSRLMRQVLENSRTDWVSLRKELKALKIYIELEQLRCDKEFEVYFEVQDDIDLDSVYVPPLIFQPYVDNAIWHGLLPMKTGTPMLRIRCRQQQEFLIIEINDNGIGRIASSKQQPNQLRNHKAAGVKLMAERIELLNEMYQANARVVIIDQYQADGLPTGTCVNFILKLLSHDRSFN